MLAQKGNIQGDKILDPARAPDSKSERKRILIVDDEVDFAESLEDILNGWGYETESAHGARSALAKQEAFGAQVALLDVRLGSDDGLDLLVKLKQKYPNLHCIMMTAYTDLDTLMGTIKRGAYDYLNKPISPPELSKTLDKCFDKIRLEEEKAVLQMQLQQSQKMEALGTMAGGIAHDFNNLLAIILGNSELAIETLKVDLRKRDISVGGTLLEENLSQIMKASKRATDIVKQILLFSRQEKQKRETVDPVATVKESLKLLRAIIPKTISIREKFENGCPLIAADPTQIHQVMMNLCSNSAHSLHESGEIIITMCPIHLAESDLGHLPARAPGNYVRLTIEDSGEGFNEEVKGKIFDPFFTTKDIGEGTGIGLAAVHSIISSHQGIISVESEVGKGTCFTIDFPEAKGKLLEPKSGTPKRRGEKQRILFVDDEEQIVALGKKILERMGYVVTDQISAADALETFRANPEDFDLIITDQSMPELSGLELASEVYKIRPNMPVILCSGYSSKRIRQSIEELGIKAFCVKPVLMDEYSKTVAAVLSESA